MSETAMNKNLLQIEQLRGGYSEVDIIHGIDLNVAPGAIVTIAGTNGAGKSTLVKAQLGLAVGGQRHGDGDHLRPLAGGAFALGGMQNNGTRWRGWLAGRLVRVRHKARPPGCPVARYPGRSGWRCHAGCGGFSGSGQGDASGRRPGVRRGQRRRCRGWRHGRKRSGPQPRSRAGGYWI